MEIVADSSFHGVKCPSCGSCFNVVGSCDTTETYRAKTRTIAHFELIERLGIGAFGSVWKARDTKLDRIVALNIMDFGLAKRESGEITT